MDMTSTQSSSSSPARPRRRSTIARRVLLTVIITNLIFFGGLAMIGWLALHDLTEQAPAQVRDFGQKALDSLMGWLPVIGGLGAVLLLIIWFVAWRLTRPIGKLADAVGAMRRGEAATLTSLPVSRSEVGELAANFNDLSESLQRSSEELEAQNLDLAESVQRLEGLRKVTEVLASTFDIDQLLRRTATTLRTVFGYERVGVAIVENDVLSFRFSSVIEDNAVFTPPTLASISERLVAGRAVLWRKPQLVAELGRLRTIMLPGFPDARSELSVPVIHQDKVVAVIDLQSEAHDAFSENDQLMLISLAPSLGVALANSSLFRDEQLRRQLAESIYRVAQSINATITPESIPALVLDQVAQLLPYDRSAVLMLRNHRLEAADERGKVGGWRWHGDDGEVTPDPRALIAKVLREGRPQINNHDDLDTPGVPRSVLAVPLMRQSRTIGVVVVERDTPGSYGHEEQRALVALVSQAAVALENVSLYAEAKEHTDRLKVVNELIEDVSSGQNLNGQNLTTVLQTIVQKIRLSVPCDYASIAHYEAGNASFRLETLYDATRNELPAPENFVADDTPWNSVAKTSYSRDLAQSIFPVEQQLAEAGLRSCVSVPVGRTKDEHLGTLTLASRSYDAFSEEQIRTLSDLSRYLATAIINARQTQERELAVSELARAQERLALTARLNAVGELAYGVAHDFNNLLAGIMGNAQILLFEVENEEQRELLQVIERASRSGAETVRRLQTFTRVNTDTVGEVALHLIARDALDLTRPRWRDLAQKQGRTIEVKRELLPVPSIIGRAGGLRDAVANLIINAVDAMPKGGMLTVRTYEVPASTQDLPDALAEIVVEVSDTGIGMSPELQARVFERFFTTKGTAGTGQGLSEVQEKAAAHGGTVELRSEEGKGTTFILRLPVRKITDEDIVAQTESEAKAPMTPCGILVVEDDDLVRESLVRLLERWGHRVTAAAGGVEALDAMVPGRFEIIMTDLGMPDIPGWEVLRRAREIDSQIHTVMLTGWGDDTEAGNHGAEFLLPKPFDQRELRSVLVRALK